MYRLYYKYRYYAVQNDALVFQHWPFHQYTLEAKLIDKTTVKCFASTYGLTFFTLTRSAIWSGFTNSPNGMSCRKATLQWAENSMFTLLEENSIRYFISLKLNVISIYYTRKYYVTYLWNPSFSIVWVISASGLKHFWQAEMSKSKAKKIKYHISSKTWITVEYLSAVIQNQWYESKICFTIKSF